MLAFNRLRVDLGNGSPAVDFRIEDGRVESRAVESAGDGSDVTERPWQALTPEQLRSHVMADTVVARWLCRRMGIQRLIRACNLDSSFPGNAAQGQSDHTAA